MKAIVNARKDASIPFDEYIEGALSCIIWTLTIQTTIKYVLVSLRADNKGEGGILALFSLVKNLKKLAIPNCNTGCFCTDCRRSNNTIAYSNVCY